MIPHLKELCYQQNEFEVDPVFVEQFVDRHIHDWREAQSHWEIIVERVLNTDAVRRDASGDEAMHQAVSAAEILLTTTSLRKQCPICRRQTPSRGRDSVNREDA
jgi:hypothetical protein